MALCKDCIHNEVCDRLYELNGIPKIGGTDCGCFKDKSDVAPQNEVDKLIGKFECFLCHATGGRLSKHTYDLGTMESVATDCINETYNDGYGEGYKECASEIFEEIYEDCFDQFGYIDYEKLAKLKKKYTEGK